ncbi:unnamed protein product [Didymodactylos carnosus]|uniref:Uncharacterized protein n=1 Tax=Didymodactylos carnosus TaxID=1234261 RepID=A0A814X421_9BILA|nr:unnamed protein product [Didymodactylos carnosus]CAF1214099.1 unnamed protein product [Didymodactylos carnosus]CAF3955258.1 unnamed protein product [Didymodactylos carnosus]CAF3978054.1 unnamed protein product [Didymodactylos carnosus]
MATSLTPSSLPTDIYFVCRNGDVERVRQQLLTTSLEEINKKQPNGSMALHAATYYGHGEIVILLLDSRARRSLKNNYNCIPYEEAPNEDVKKLFIRPLSNRFFGDGTGRIEWVKSDDDAAEVAIEQLNRELNSEQKQN